MTDLHTKPQLTTIEVRNPADGSVVGEVPVDTPETVAAKAAELRLHQPEWEAMGAKGRKPWLLKFQDWILDNAEHITDVRAVRVRQAERRGLDGSADVRRRARTTGRAMRRRFWPTATPSRTPR